MKIALWIIVVMALPLGSAGQTTGNATSTGTCNVSNTGHSNNVVLQCGIGKEQGQKIVSILNKILSHQLDTDKVMEKLDELIAAQSKQPAVVGNDNVVGNVVTGNQNLVGNNNQLNVGLYPPRIIPTEHLKQFADYLSATPYKVMILYPQGDSEAFKYANGIAQILRGSNWTVEGPTSAMILSSGAPLYGVNVTYTGDTVGPGQTVSYSAETSWGRLAGVLEAIQGGKDVFLTPSPKWTEGLIEVAVYTNPKAKPQ